MTMIEQPLEQTIEPRETHLRDYLRILRKRMKIIVLVFGIVFVVSAVKTFTTTPIYSASTKVLIEKTEPGDILSNYGYVSYDPEFLATQSHIITSMPVAQKVVALLNLEKTYDTFTSQHSGGFSPLRSIKGWVSGLMRTISNLFSSDSAAQAGADAGDGENDRQNQLAQLVRGGLSVSPVPESRIVNINFSSPNPALAAIITNSVAKAYIEQILEMQMSSSNYSIGWMTKKADEERAKLEAAEKTLQAYMKAHDILTIEDRITILPQKLAEISSQLTQAQTERKAMETVYLSVKDVLQGEEDPLTLPVINGDAMIKSLNQKILETRQHIMELSKKYGPKHALMRNADSELAMLTENRDQEIQRIIKSIQNEYELAKSTEENMQAMLSDIKADTVELNERFIQYNILKREVETNRNMYDALVSRIKEQSVTEQIQRVDVWVVEEAQTPVAPSQPNIPRNLMLGIVLGLFAGVGLVLFLEYLDNTIKLPEDLEEQFDIPVLGLVPLEKEKEKTDSEKELEETPSAFRESFNALQSSIQLSAHESPPKTILVTSNLPKEGKTTSATHLAETISRSGKKVLLIDADMRRPRVHKIFDIKNDKGLSTSMAGASDMKVIQKSRIENLDIIPSGPVPPNPAELLGSERFRATLKLLSEKYHTIVIDSPPLLSVMDSYHISKVVDGTILIVRSAKTTYDAMYKGLKHLDEVGAKILGAVINGADFKKSGYYYYDYYHYYGSEDEE